MFEILGSNNSKVSMEIQKNMAVCFGVCEKRDRKSG
jgi:hypothetical protein